MKSIFVDIFNRLQQNKTSKCIRCFLVFLCVFISKHDGQIVLQIIDSIQPKLLLNLIERFFPTIPLIEGKFEKKMVLVALTKLLAGVMLISPYDTAWATVVTLAIDCVQGNTNEQIPQFVHGADLDLGEEEISGGASYSRLSNAIKVDSDPVPDVASGAAFFAKAIQQLTQTTPQIVILTLYSTNYFSTNYSTNYCSIISIY